MPLWLNVSLTHWRHWVIISHFVSLDFDDERTPCYIRCWAYRKHRPTPCYIRCGAVNGISCVVRVSLNALFLCESSCRIQFIVKIEHCSYQHHKLTVILSLQGCPKTQTTTVSRLTRPLSVYSEGSELRHPVVYGLTHSLSKPAVSAAVQFQFQFQLKMAS